MPRSPLRLPDLLLQSLTMPSPYVDPIFLTDIEAPLEHVRTAKLHFYDLNLVRPAPCRAQAGASPATVCNRTVAGDDCFSEGLLGLDWRLECGQLWAALRWIL